MDSVGEVFGAVAARPSSSIAGWWRCPSHQSVVRAHASSVPGTYGSLTREAFLSARNDVLANVAIITTAFVTAYTLSGWPDLIVGLGIAAMNADAAREVWSVACEEHRVANS